MIGIRWLFFLKFSFAFTCFARRVPYLQDSFSRNMDSLRSLSAILLRNARTPQMRGLRSFPSGRFSDSDSRLAEPSIVERRQLLISCLAGASIFASPSTVDAVLSATSFAGKARADLGVVLLAAPSQSGKTISSDIVLEGGLLAHVTFDSNWKLARRPGFSDVEANGKASGDATFLAVKSLPQDKSILDVSESFFITSLFGSNGRFGAYGPPEDVEVIKDTKVSESTRTLEVRFAILNPRGSPLARKGLVTARAVPGSNDIVILISSTSASKWQESESQAETSLASTTLLISTRKTELTKTFSSDYRSKATTFE